jgi:hypothetical protein
MRLSHPPYRMESSHVRFDMCCGLTRLARKEGLIPF